MDPQTAHWYLCWMVGYFVFYSIIILGVLVLFVRSLFGLGHKLMHPDPDPPPMKLEEYEALLDEVQFENIKWRGLGWRLFKTYWKRIFFILFMLMIPPLGWIILFICSVFWAINYEKGMKAMFDEAFARYRREGRRWQ